MNQAVTAVLVRGEEVIIGGDFTSAGGVPATRIAKWNGTSWSAFPGNPVPNTVSGIAFVGNDMYVSSATTTLENPNYLLKYDGSTWTGLASGMGGHGITSMAVLGTDVYVSGGFQAVGGVAASRVAKWNGSNWSALDAGLPTTTGSGSVHLGTLGNDLIAVGDFTTAAGAATNFIARWNGSSWSALGNGLNASASGVRSAGGNLWVVGGFTTAGCNLSPFVARWRENVWTGSTSTDWHNTANWGSGSVPPANAGVTIGDTNASISSADVTVSSLIITNGRSLVVGAGRTLTVTGYLDLGNGFLSGPGNLVVNGDLSLNGGDVTDMGSIVVHGNLYLNGGKILGTGPVSLTACRPGAIAGGSSSSFITSTLTRCINSTGTYRFPVGTGSVYAPVELSNITGSGNFTVESKSGAHPGAIGLPGNRLQRWWALTNGGITQADMTFTYADSEVVGIESWYRVYSIDGGSAVQLPTAINTTTNRMTVNGVTSFSAWTLAEGTPAPLTMFGRVTGASGRGAWGVIVSLTDGQGNTTYGVVNPFGYYRFQNVPTFNTYTVRVMSRKYTFSTSERSVQFDEFTPSVTFSSTDH
jgi:hypothetical protein